MKFFALIPFLLFSGCLSVIGFNPIAVKTSAPVLKHQGWNDVVSSGTRTDSSGNTLKAANLSFSWNLFLNLDPTFTGWKIYRATSSGGENFTMPIGTTTASVRTFTDTTAVAGTTYYYVVRPVVAGTAVATSENYSEIKIVAAPANLALVHRWIANQEMCATLQSTSDPTQNYRCPYTGLANANGYFDQGHSFLIDQVEVGCNYTPAPACGDAVHGCIEAPGVGNSLTKTGVLGNVIWDRSNVLCYYNNGSMWVKIRDIDAATTTSLGATVASANSYLPPLSQISQPKAQAACGTQTAGTFGPMRLPTHREQIIASAWSPNLTDAAAQALEGGSNLTTTGACDTLDGNSLTYDNLAYPAQPDTLYATQDNHSTGVRTGSAATQNCVSRYGAQDLIGNVWEWASDQLLTCDSTAHICVGGTSSIDTNNSDWSGFSFNGSDGPGGATINSIDLDNQPNSISSFLPTLGLPYVSLPTANGGMLIGSGTGQFNPTLFHNAFVNLRTDNPNGTPARGATGGGNFFDFGSNGRYMLTLTHPPTDEVTDTGFRCVVNTD